MLASMFNLPFANSQFDLIWSEGAIFIIGFERGVREWKRLLKPGGQLVVSDVCWLQSKPTVPAECVSFWDKDYPSMGSVGSNMEAAFAAGYRVQATLLLPDSGWWEYYGPLQKNRERLLQAHPEDEEVAAFVREGQKGIEIFQQYGAYYGYVFFIMQAL